MTRNNYSEVNGRQFTTSRQLPIWARAKIESQPGYRSGQPMTIAPTVHGGYRLYVSVSGRWMDGSLADINSAR